MYVKCINIIMYHIANKKTFKYIHTKGTLNSQKPIVKYGFSPYLSKMMINGKLLRLLLFAGDQQDCGHTYV